MLVDRQARTDNEILKKALWDAQVYQTAVNEAYERRIATLKETTEQAIAARDKVNREAAKARGEATDAKALLKHRLDALQVISGMCFGFGIDSGSEAFALIREAAVRGYELPEDKSKKEKDGEHQASGVQERAGVDRKKGRRQPKGGRGHPCILDEEGEPGGEGCQSQPQEG